MKAQLKESQRILDRLRNGEVKLFDELYSRYRSEFLKWIYRDFSLEGELAADLYQDCFLALYDNIRLGKLTELRVNLKTYIFSIGKNLALKRLRQTKLEVEHETKYAQLFSHIDEPLPDHENERLQAVEEALEDIEDPCRSILEGFYFHRLNMEEIAHKLGYKNSDTVKSQKVRCMKRLREIVKDHIVG